MLLGKSSSFLLIIILKYVLRRGPRHAVSRRRAANFSLTPTPMIQNRRAAAAAAAAAVAADNMRQRADCCTR